MATKKTTAAKRVNRTKPAAKKTFKTGGLRFGTFSMLQLFLFGVIFAFVGGSIILFTRAASCPASMTQWCTVASRDNCPLNGLLIPPTITQASNPSPNCTTMLKRIIFNKTPYAANIGTVDGNFGPGTTAAVIHIKTDFKVYDSLRVIDGNVDPATWVVIQYIVLHSTYSPGAYQPPPPPTTGFGVEPLVSGKLNAADNASFNANYAAYQSAGWCIANHESRSGGLYTAIQSSGKGPATGAFQIQGGYPNRDIPPASPDSVGNHFGAGNSNTWANFYGIQYAAVAPPDVQWTKFFQIWVSNPHAWHGTNCPGT